LDEGHPGAEQRGEFLIEHEEFARADTPPLRQPDADPGYRVLRLEREDVQAPLFELVAQTRLAVGDVHAFDNLPVSRCKPTAEFHSNRNCIELSYGPL